MAAPGTPARYLARVKIGPQMNPLVARAYGLPQAPRPASPVKAPAIEARAARVQDAASVSAVRTPDVAARLSGVSAATRVRELVAATVPGRVDFDDPAVGVLSAGGSYTMHGRPADRNAAALGVQAGRSLDVTG